MNRPTAPPAKPTLIVRLRAWLALGLVLWLLYVAWSAVMWVLWELLPM